MDKKLLSERDICTKCITPSIVKAGWDIDTQVLEEVSFTDGKIYVRGRLTARGTRKRADYIGVSAGSSKKVLCDGETPMLQDHYSSGSHGFCTITRMKTPRGLGLR